MITDQIRSTVYRIDPLEVSAIAQRIPRMAHIMPIRPVCGAALADGWIGVLWGHRLNGVFTPSCRRQVILNTVCQAGERVRAVLLGGDGSRGAWPRAR
jgi:hypothetical protein